MRTASALFAATLTATLVAQTPPLKPGEYEILMETSMPGQPGKLPPQKLGHCFTPQELQDLANSLANGNAQQSCKIQNSKTVGSTLTFTTECSNPDGSKLVLSGQVNFTSQESYRSVVTMKGIGAGSPFANGTTMTMTGKRVGNCSK